MYVAQVIIDIDFPQAESLENAENTLHDWLDIIGDVMCDKVHWPVVSITEVSEVEDQ